MTDDLLHVQIPPRESLLTVGTRKFHTTIRRYPDGTVSVVDVSLCPLECPDETGIDGVFRQSHPITVSELPGG